MTNPRSAIVLAATVSAGVLLAATGSALAMGGGNSSSGSGLSPYATESGNDRSAGVNNGNYAPSRYNYYRRAYGPRDEPYYGGRGRNYDGYPY